MANFLRRIIAWFAALGRTVVSIFHEDWTEPEPGAAPEVQQGPSRGQIARPSELAIGSAEQPVYEKSKFLLTFRERQLYYAICSATSGEYTVLVKVRMGDFVWLRNEPKDRKFFNNQVLCKHVDFLLCEPQFLKPLLVIELDDSSHIKKSFTIDSDTFKNETFAAIGMPLLRLPVQQQYDCEKLRSAIQEKIGEQKPERSMSR